MALNLDDLIGEMQHGLTAGDRGAEIHDIRENLLAVLGAQALGPGQGQGQGQGQAMPARRQTRGWVNGGSGVGAGAGEYGEARLRAANGAGGNMGQGPGSGSGSDVPMQLSTSINSDRAGPSAYGLGYSHAHQGQGQAQGQGQGQVYGRSPVYASYSYGRSPIAADHNGGAQSSSVGSLGSSSFSSGGFGGFAGAPANTPVERSALAAHYAQLATAAQNAQGQGQGQGLAIVPEMNTGSPHSQTNQSGAGWEHIDGSPRKLVSGFSPQPDGGYAVSSASASASPSASSPPPFQNVHAPFSSGGAQGFGAMGDDTPMGEDLVVSTGFAQAQPPPVSAQQ